MSQGHRPIVSGFIYLSLGLLLWGWMAGVIPDPERTWPLLIIAIGIGVIVKALTRSRKRTPADS